MGEHEGWAQPQSGLLLNGLLPNEAAAVMRVLDPERWSKAEEKTTELIACIQPNPPSEERRNAVADYVQRLITKCFPCKAFTFGSVPLKTYLPDGDIDLTAFSKNQTLKDTWAHQVRDILESEEKNENAEFRVKEVQYIQAEVKIIKCLVENIVVDISFNQLGGLCTLCFLEEVDHLINQNHLFKRSIILIKAWCYYESRILGAHHGLISTYALETLVLYIFHVFNNSLAGPLEVLYRFLEFFSKFDWDNFCVSLWGPVPISSLPDVTAEPPRKDGGDLLLSKLFLDACSSVYAVFPGGQENQGQSFVSKHFNVIDPLRVNNNLGRSVSKGNFFRIRSAFAFGAKRLARLLDCPKEDLCFEVNQFFMNTWDRHGSGHRPDAPRNDLWRLRVSSQDHLLGPENLKDNTGSKIDDCFSSQEARNDESHGSFNVPSQQGNFSVEGTSRTSDVSTASHTQSQKSYGNSNNSRTSDQIKKENSLNQGAPMDKAQKNLKPDNLVNDVQGRFLFARTRSSPELTEAYGEVSSPVRSSKARESGKNQTSSTRLDNSRKKNIEPDSVASHDIKSTDDPSSVRRISSRKSIDTAVDSRSGSNSYLDELGLGPMADDFASVSGTQGMQLEEQDFVNMMASSAAHGYNGQVHIPLNLASHHLPLPIPPNVLASMGYAQRNMGGMVPTNIPLMEAPWGTNMQFPHGVVPSPLSHYFPGMRLTSNPEDPAEHPNENFSSAEMNSVEADHDFWHEQDRGSTGGFDLDNGGFEMHQSDDRQQSTSAGYNFHPSSRVGSSGSSRVQQKFTKENRGSGRDDHVDDFQYRDSRGNEAYFDDRTTSSRSRPASHTGSLRSKTSSESSWDGSSAKVSKSTREMVGQKTAAVSSAICGKETSASEHSSTQADDDSRDWNLPSTASTEMVERSTGPDPTISWHTSRHQVPGFESTQTSGSDSLFPLAPVILNPGSRHKAVDNSGVLPFTFYATGPPVPFVTMLPLYNYPTDAGTSDASTSHFSGDEGLDNSDSVHNFDSSEGLDQHEVLNTSDSMRRVASFEPSEHKADILNSDFPSHWQNLQYGRFCQNSRHPAPASYPSPLMGPPTYLQGRVPFDGPGRPLSTNMNLFTQLAGYGPRLVHVGPMQQSMSSRPTNVYQRYVDEMPRYRSGTGTYLPNPKVSVRDRHSSNTRRGNYSHDRNDHYSDREGNWNANPKSRGSGRGHNRNHTEKQNSRLDRMAANESRSERPWGSHRHDSFPSYQSQNGPIRSNTTHGASTNVAYGMYPMPGMNPGGVSSNGPSMPYVVMFNPYENNTGYGSQAEQLEFGSLGPMGYSNANEVAQVSEGGRISGVLEEQRFHASSAQELPDQPPPSSHIQRGRSCKSYSYMIFL
ncbi:hypothetical protein UlMin_021685 [Ulmus minor]